MPPETPGFRSSHRQRGVLWLCLCLSSCLFWGGMLPAQGETSEIIRQQDEEEARKKVLRASDTLDQIEGTVEGHTRELQQLQQELSQMREELRHLRERLAQASVSPPEAEKAKAKGKATASSSPPERAAAESEPHTKVVTGYYYKVQAGDTLSAIAEAYRQSGVSVTAEQIRAANGLSRKESLRPGQKLFIPKEGSRKRGISGKPAAPPS
ncbi:LysM domain-containing protein [Methylacidimicrobium sp. B4]|uniref:LysM peptidoglycan-binding domain-containing protein n=1 Tax=Methylacidimicrobium sp. B4 TaxID=2796139 RepID=UPI001A904C01|nr:LysM domain-containing protein [Methylacidimicrobium sp. B4]QSR85530.1 LysM peptidoglycan-binding domain-containing protein [Methylacidimicrobium sp. B4]